MTKKTTTEQLNHVEASLRRWHTRLKIASNKIEKLVKRRRSLMLKLAGLPEIVPSTAEIKTAGTGTPSASDDDEGSER